MPEYKRRNLNLAVLLLRLRTETMSCISFNNTHLCRGCVTISSMKKLARFLAEMVVHHIFPAVVFTIVFFKALQVMMPNPGDGLGQALTAFIYFIPGLLVWILVWNAVRMLFKTDSEPADQPELDSLEPIKLSVEVEESAKGTPIKHVATDKPGSSAGVWMAWFWGLVAVGWFGFFAWMLSR